MKLKEPELRIRLIPGLALAYLLRNIDTEESAINFDA